MVYAESSAVLAWLLGEPTAETVRQALAEAEAVVTSDLTLVECDRVLVRAVVEGRLLEAEATGRQGRLANAAAHWTLLTVSPEVLARARRPFPLEPIRTLDALHLATALRARASGVPVAVLALDHRIRDCAARLGFEVQPASEADAARG